MTVGISSIDGVAPLSVALSLTVSAVASLPLAASSEAAVTGGASLAGDALAAPSSDGVGTDGAACSDGADDSDDIGGSYGGNVGAAYGASDGGAGAGSSGGVLAGVLALPFEALSVAMLDGMPLLMGVLLQVSYGVGGASVTDGGVGAATFSLGALCGAPSDPPPDPLSAEASGAGVSGVGGFHPAGRPIMVGISSCETGGWPLASATGVHASAIGSVAWDCASPDV